MKKSLNPCRKFLMMESEPTPRKREHHSRMRSKILEDEDIVLGDNLEQLLWEINEFCGRNNTKQDDIPAPLENYLKYVAKTGNTVFPWQHVRPLFRMKMLSAINNFAAEMCPNEQFVMERFDIFRAAPFTIQRLAELIIYPSRHYKIKEKFLRGLEKTVLVVTTVEPKSVDEENGEEIVTEEPMSWLSPDGPLSTAEPLLKSESDLNSLNQLIATVHPAPAVEPTTPRITEATTVVESKNIEDSNKNGDADAGPGISDIAMPLNIAASSLDYNIDIEPNKNNLSSATSDNYPLESTTPPVTNEDYKHPVSAPSAIPATTESLEKKDNETKAPESFKEESEPDLKSSQEDSTSAEEEVPMEHTSSLDSDSKSESSTDSSSDSSSMSDKVSNLTPPAFNTEPSSAARDVAMDESESDASSSSTETNKSSTEEISSVGESAPDQLTPNP